VLHLQFFLFSRTLHHSRDSLVPSACLQGDERVRVMRWFLPGCGCGGFGVLPVERAFCVGGLIVRHALRTSRRT
jgi:hypothetical protein